MAVRLGFSAFTAMAPSCVHAKVHSRDHAIGGVRATRDKLSRRLTSLVFRQQLKSTFAAGAAALGGERGPRRIEPLPAEWDTNSLPSIREPHRFSPCRIPMPKSRAKSQAPTPSDALIQEDALRVARSIQRPGQTKEQTKLIAQGVAQGIALYKKQQSEKARALDKARKRASKRSTAEAGAGGPQDLEATAGDRSEGERGRAPLITGAVLFALVSGLHLFRALAGWELVIGAWSVPVWCSWVAVPISAGLSGWFFLSARR